MSTERKRILEMLAEGKITADEADRLLTALEQNAATVESAPVAATGRANGRKPKFFHVKVKHEPGSGHRHENVDIRIPIMLLKAGVKLGSVMPGSSKAELNSHLKEHGMAFDLNDLSGENLDNLISSLTESSIDIDADGKQVKIFCS
ncbi:hypothetical protein GF420_06750 [candidate division GN15 bacterium]|nr:hypothetical protein [candidate division GN15 bacterium]